jgi:orotate phosphoribosyltransferase
VLSSGHTSTFLFQLRQTRDCLHRRLELGAVPVVSAMAAVSHVKGFPVDAFFVRTAQNKHGAGEC